MFVDGVDHISAARFPLRGDTLVIHVDGGVAQCWNSAHICKDPERNDRRQGEVKVAAASIFGMKGRVFDTSGIDSTDECVEDLVALV